ncbi:MAG: hypothetical protein JXA44_07790 [Methanospirillaceae archaeon]|nr:hypothetical protein [Methanospirillaceae archaeon]
MNLILIARDGIDLYETLANSETSFHAIRFYEPDNLGFGVGITVPSTAGAFSLISDLRYYTRRFVQEVLFGLYPPCFCSELLAEEIYLQRTGPGKTPWPYRLLYCIAPYSCVEKYRIADPGHIVSPCSFIKGHFQAEVWCVGEEYEQTDSSI